MDWHKRYHGVDLWDQREDGYEVEGYRVEMQRSEDAAKLCTFKSSHDVNKQFKEVTGKSGRRISTNERQANMPAYFSTRDPFKYNLGMIELMKQ